MLILFATIFKYDTLLFDNEEFIDHCTINTKDHKHDMKQDLPFSKLICILLAFLSCIFYEQGMFDWIIIRFIDFYQGNLFTNKSGYFQKHNYFPYNFPLLRMAGFYLIQLIIQSIYMYKYLVDQLCMSIYVFGQIIRSCRTEVSDFCALKPTLSLSSQQIAKQTNLFVNQKLVAPAVLSSNFSSIKKQSLNVGKFLTQITLFSFPPKNERNICTVLPLLNRAKLDQCFVNFFEERRTRYLIYF